MDHQMTDPFPLHRAVRFVALLNLGYFGIEFVVARAIGSVSLFADSIDFLEDATVNGLIFIALGWSAAQRSIVGMIPLGKKRRSGECRDHRSGLSDRADPVAVARSDRRPRGLRDESGCVTTGLRRRTR
jgi:hypothetical protein